jgi:parvulin-like peptidyl-prolyl isomerase
MGGRQLPPIGQAGQRPPPIETIDDPAVALVIDGERIDRASFGEALIQEYGASFIEPYVGNYLMERRAKELKVDVPAADVEAAVEKQKRELIERNYRGDEMKLRAALASTGMTLEQWLEGRRRVLRRDLLARAVVRADRDVSPGALVREFEARFGKGGEKRAGRYIYVSTQVWTSGLYTAADYDAEKAAIEADAKKRAEEARLELAKGKDFAELARARSEDGLAVKGGDYGRYWKNRFGAEADRRLAQLKPGETSEVIHTPRGSLVARATGVHEGWELAARRIHLSTRVAGQGGEALREKKIAEAKEEAAKLLAAIREGKTTFEQAARERSDDLRSKEKGGDLGTFQSGTLAPELESALIALADGAIGEPVAAGDGVHLLQLVSKKRRPDLDTPLISVMLFSTEFLKVKERKLGGVIEERASALAADLKKRLEAGEDAAELARKHTEDHAARESGGEVPDPWKPGTPPEVPAAFAALAKPGDTALVKAERGIYVLKLERIEKHDFDAEKAALEKELREREPTPVELRDYREALRMKAKVQKSRM